ncbi:MAG: AMP-binding protein [Candidatus Rokubacteria bacterium]|nr:AMP-binding protein [Candidatus Rokubacteria bacterium]
MQRADRLKGYYDRRRETMGLRARRRYQETWLKALVASAWRRAPGVRRRMASAGLEPPDIRTLEDLDRLPVIEKAAMPDLQRADPPFGGFCTARPSALHWIFISPGPIYEPFERRERSPWRTEVSAFAGGFRPGDVVVNTFLYHLTPAAHLIDRGLALLGCTIVPTGPGNTELQVKTILDLRATGYVGTPSFLMTILKHAAERGLGRLGLEVAHVGAEALPESLRRSFEDEYGILTRQSFGTADLGIVAYECREASGMHVMEDVIFQICNPQTGAPLPAGQVGEVVCTVNHKTYPMIRFGTGDLSVLTDAPCPCGRTSPRMLGWRGRADEVTKVRGMFIHPRQADETVARFPAVTRYQVVVTRQDHQDVLTFNVELGQGGDAHQIQAGLVGAVREVMKLRAEVRVLPPGTIPERAKKIEDQRKWD